MEWSNCKICGNWARVTKDWTERHHISCPLHTDNLLGLIKSLVEIIENKIVPDNSNSPIIYDYYVAKELLEKVKE